MATAEEVEQIAQRVCAILEREKDEGHTVAHATVHADLARLNEIMPINHAQLSSLDDDMLVATCVLALALAMSTGVIETAAPTSH